MSSKGDRTRRTVLAAASQQLRKYGAARVRMEDLARGAGISRQALYLHFPSRTDLMVALIDHITEEVGGASLFRDAAAVADPGEALERSLRASVQYFARIRDVVIALDVARHTDEGAAQVWNQRMEARHRGIRRAVSRLAKEGRLRPGWTVGKVTDAIWMFSAPRAYLDLVVERGWSHETVEELLIALLGTFLVARPK